MDSGPRRLTILHTNDIHSHFDMMAPLAAVLRKVRTEAEDTVLSVDIGDHMDRAAPETEGTMGQANVDLMNLAGYDAVTIGNNEGLTLSPAVLQAAYSGLQCPVVCCNINESATGEPPAWMKRSVILERRGIRIGLTGATAPFGLFYSLLGWDALEPEAALRRECEHLAQQADVVLVLSHLGLQADRLLAERLDGVHAILGGHTHHVLEEPLLIAGTAVCGAGKFGQYVGRLTLERPEEGGAFRYTSGGVIAVAPGGGDTASASAIALHESRAAEALRRTVAFTDRPLPVDWDGESPFGNLLAQAIRRFTGAELALVNSGQLLGGLPEGEITAGMLHALCPSPINPCVMKLSGREIRTALTQSLDNRFCRKPIFGYGFRGKVLGTLALDGLSVDAGQADTAQAAFKPVITVGGEPLDDEREYRVGTIDMFTFRIGYETLAEGKEIVYLLPHFLRDLIAMELKRPGSLDESAVPRLTS